MSIELTLPFPPSANTYWRHPSSGKLAGRHLISKRGREYRKAVISCVSDQEADLKPLEGSLSVDVVAYMPDRRRRDLDNLLKSMLDSLTHAGVWGDDSQITDLRIRKSKTIGGMVKVRVFPDENT